MTIFKFEESYRFHEIIELKSLASIPVIQYIYSCENMHFNIIVIAEQDNGISPGN